MTSKYHVVVVVDAHGRGCGHRKQSRRQDYIFECKWALAEDGCFEDDVTHHNRLTLSITKKSHL